MHVGGEVLTLYAKNHAGFIGIVNNYIFQAPLHKKKKMGVIHKRICPPKLDSSAGKCPAALST